MRRFALVCPLLLAAMFAAAANAGAQTWHSEQPPAGIGVPVGLGEVGDVEFEAPNAGMLITAGNEGIPAGLFAYDGTGWYRYSTVCGGHEGRIAWAGPDDFWTISDQQRGQETGKAPAQQVSLCHFVNGAVVASYAQPLGASTSYLPMDAAACDGPDDCWFAGERLPGTVNQGAFHLYWDGSSVTAIPSLAQTQPELEDPGRSVSSLAFHQGTLYEGVAVREGDVAPNETQEEPSFVHQIFAGGGTVAFFPLLSEGPIAAEPTQLEGFRLAADEEELWALAGADGSEGSVAPVTALRVGEAGVEPVALEDPGGVLPAGDRLGGAAAEPGGEAAWVGFRAPNESASAPAHLTRIHADGSVDPETVLPAAGEGIGHKGPAGPITCPASEQCWMATRQGWLFHLGPDLPQNTDPGLHALVTYRPPDASLPTVPPIGLPEDNSGAYKEEEEEALPENQEEPLPRHRGALITKLHEQLVGKSTLELTFVLRARAHVRLLAKRKGRVVAKTKRLTMAKGKGSLRLRLDPKLWPTKLDLQAHAIKKRKSK